MRKQYKKARYKRAAQREYERACPGMKALRKNIEGLKKAWYECGRRIAKGINNLILCGELKQFSIDLGEVMNGNVDTRNNDCSH